MVSTRTLVLSVSIIVFLIAVFYLASLRPLGDVSNLPGNDTAAAAPAAVSIEAGTESKSSSEQSTELATTSVNEQDSTKSQDSVEGNKNTFENAQNPEEQSVEIQESGVRKSDREGTIGAADSADNSNAPADAQQDNTQPNSAQANIETKNVTADSAEDVTLYTYKVINSYPHDPEAFTQGLIWHKGFLYEGTGLKGRSTLRKVALDDGTVTKRTALPEEFFGEGITLFNERIYQLTWQSNKGFVYDPITFEELFSFEYPTEGWGITNDGEQLIMSDGSTQLFYLDPFTMERTGIIDVTLRNEKVERLNELEYINGMIYANIWQTNFIAIIDPETGYIRGMVNLSGLLQVAAGYSQPVDVLNGIAYDVENGRLFVTGKLWPKLYEIELIESN